MIEFAERRHIAWLNPDPSDHTHCRPSCPGSFRF